VQVTVLREACCAQDDQLGPLEATYETKQSTTLGEFLAAIVESRFLQYSASHASLVAFVGDRPLARVFSAYYSPGRSAEFSVPSTSLVTDLVGNQAVHFRFV
jgi:hypothetical protein